MKGTSLSELSKSSSIGLETSQGSGSCNHLGCESFSCHCSLSIALCLSIASSAQHLNLKSSLIKLRGLSFLFLSILTKSLQFDEESFLVSRISIPQLSSPPLLSSNKISDSKLLSSGSEMRVVDSRTASGSSSNSSSMMIPASRPFSIAFLLHHDIAVSVLQRE